jgi:hypothetical protein
MPKNNPKCFWVKDYKLGIDGGMCARLAVSGYNGACEKHKDIIALVAKTTGEAYEGLINAMKTNPAIAEEIEVFRKAAAKSVCYGMKAKANDEVLAAALKGLVLKDKANGNDDDEGEPAEEAAAVEEVPAAAE